MIQKSKTFLGTHSTQAYTVPSYDSYTTCAPYVSSSCHGSICMYTARQHLVLYYKSQIIIWIEIYQFKLSFICHFLLMKNAENLHTSGTTVMYGVLFPVQFVVCSSVHVKWKWFLTFFAWMSFGVSYPMDMIPCLVTFIFRYPMSIYRYH